MGIDRSPFTKPGCVSLIAGVVAVLAIAATLTLAGTAQAAPADGGNSPMCAGSPQTQCTWQGPTYLETKNSGSATAIRAVSAGGGWYYLKEGGRTDCLQVPPLSFTLVLSKCAGKYSQEFAWDIEEGTNNYLIANRNLGFDYLMAENGNGKNVSFVYNPGESIPPQEIWKWPVQI